MCYDAINEKSGINLEVGIMAKRTRRTGFAEGGQSAYSLDPDGHVLAFAQLPTRDP